MTKRFEVTKPSQVTKRRCAMRTPKGKPKGRAASTAAVAIDGADSKGKANDKEVCGDAAAVSQRRSEAPRRRAAAIQVYLDKIKPVAKAPVSAAALAADRAAMQRVDGIVAKTAGKVATDEHTFDQFVDEQAVRLEEGMYPSAETMVEFAAWLTRLIGVDITLRAPRWSPELIYTVKLNSKASENIRTAADFTTLNTV